MCVYVSVRHQSHMKLFIKKILYDAWHVYKGLPCSWYIKHIFFGYPHKEFEYTKNYLEPIIIWKPVIEQKKKKREENP